MRPFPARRCFLFVLLRCRSASPLQTLLQALQKLLQEARVLATVRGGECLVSHLGVGSLRQAALSVGAGCV